MVFGTHKAPSRELAGARSARAIDVGAAAGRPPTDPFTPRRLDPPNTYTALMVEPVVIVSYDSEWSRGFAQLEAALVAALGPRILRVEHVGSTAVPGLCAKPIVDLDVVIANDADLAELVVRLDGLGYEHTGDQGVPGREAFRASSAQGPSVEHHLYVCREGAAELRRHLAFRDFLITHPAHAQEYGALKRGLADSFGKDREGYTSAKTEFIERVLREAGATR